MSRYFYETAKKMSFNGCLLQNHKVTDEETIFS